MIVKAYAKINIALDVLRKQDDGFHELDMVMAPLDLHDSIEISLVPPSFDTLVTCDSFDLTTGEYNLCTIAVNKMREFYKFKEKFRIHIHKRIPMSAGFGGGSSDAAATIHGIIKLLKLQTKESDIIALCRSIGSDVPYFYRLLPSRVQGTGEILTPIIIKNHYYVLIVKPVEGLSTKEVFARYDQMSGEKHDIMPVIEALTSGDDAKLKESMFNALEPAAISLCPEVAEIKQKLTADGVELVSMSGSGSAVFALDKRLNKLEKLAKKYINLGYIVLLTEIKK